MTDAPPGLRMPRSRSADSRHRILVIDHDGALGSRLAAAAQEFVVDYLPPRLAELPEIQRRRPQLIVSGYSVSLDDTVAICRSVRESAALANVPFLVLSRSARDQDEIRAFDSGASDYVARVVSIELLSRRLRVALGLWDVHRSGAAMREERSISIGDLAVRENSYAATVAGKRVDLTVSEFRILWKLAVNAGRMLSYEQLLPAHADPERPLTPKMVRFHIASLRRKLGTRAAAYLQTIRNAGYRLGIDEHAPSSD